VVSNHGIRIRGYRSVTVGFLQWLKKILQWPSLNPVSTPLAYLRHIHTPTRNRHNKGPLYSTPTFDIRISHLNLIHFCKEPHIQLLKLYIICSNYFNWHLIPAPILFRLRLWEWGTYFSTSEMFLDLVWPVDFVDQTVGDFSRCRRREWESESTKEVSRVSRRKPSREMIFEHYTDKFPIPEEDCYIQAGERNL
jgi:hypothetical protein